MMTIFEWQGRQKHRGFVDGDPLVLMVPGEITDATLYGASVLDMTRPCNRWRDKAFDSVMVWYADSNWHALNRMYSVSTPELVRLQDIGRLNAYLTMMKAREMSIGAVMVAYQMSRFMNIAQYLPTIWFEEETDAVNFSLARHAENS